MASAHPAAAAVAAARAARRSTPSRPSGAPPRRSVLSERDTPSGFPGPLPIDRGTPSGFPGPLPIDRGTPSGFPGPLRPGSVHRLTGLFERAKFSQHRIGEGDREQAIAALRAVRRDLAEAVERAAEAQAEAAAEGEGEPVAGGGGGRR
jgi:hypothetical protein